MKKALIAAGIIAAAAVCLAVLYPFYRPLFCDHDYIYVSTDVKATCTEEGIRTDRCSKCGNTVQTVTPMNEHNWIAATCTEPMRCTVCGQTSGEAAGHRWQEATCAKPKRCAVCGLTEGTVSEDHKWTEATCTEPKTCSVCGKTSGKAAGHRWTAATCTAPKTCSECGATSGSALGHDFQGATCTTAGRCSRCGAEGAKAGHSWVAATCSAPKTCSKCGATSGTAAGHTWKEATCTAPRTCSKCGATSGSALGHDFKGATCTTAGRCARCGAAGAKAEHSWKAATCTSPKTCSKCGATSGSALGHDFKGATCTSPGKCTRCGAAGSKAEHRWKDATCTAPKTCSVCGATSGSALGHDYVNNKCRRCGKTGTSSQNMTSSAPSTHGYYYSTLKSSTDRAVYDAIYECVSNTEAKLEDEDLFDEAGLTFDGAFRIFGFVTDDHPELFHLSSELSGSMHSDRSLASLNFTYSMNRSQYAAALDSVNKALSSVLSEAAKAADDAERARILYDSVKANLEYDTSFSKTSYDMYGAMTTGRGVCEAYSELFSYLLGRAGIESAIVRGVADGGRHQWNMAKLNGKWYYFDVTFDDPVGGSLPGALNYNYFAVDDKTISKDHSLSSDISPLVPKANSKDDNFFVKNGLTLGSLDSDAMKAAAERSYSVCGHVAIMCTPEVLGKITGQDTTYYFDLVKYAFGSSSKSTTYIYSDVSGVIEIFLK